VGIDRVTMGVAALETEIAISASFPGIYSIRSIPYLFSTAVVSMTRIPHRTTLPEVHRAEVEELGPQKPSRTEG
jgi:hypothetical protein